MIHVTRRLMLVAFILATFAALAIFAAANTLLAPPTPVGCGTWSSPGSSTGAAITARYGEIRNCLLVDKTWMITTLGNARSPGVIATYPCGDGTCLDPRTEHAIANWHITAAPSAGGVTLLRSDPTNERVLVSNGGREFFFDVGTLAFSPAQ